MTGLSNNEIVARMITNDQLGPAYNEFIVLMRNKPQLLAVIHNAYAGELENIPKIVAFLYLFLNPDPNQLNFAIWGADALYRQMELPLNQRHLKEPELFHLHHLVKNVVAKLLSSEVPRNRRLYLRVGYLMKSMEVHVDTIQTSWIQVLQSNGYEGDISIAALNFPEDIAISRLIRDGYSGRVSHAPLIAAFLHHLRPQYRLIMLGFKELFLKMQQCHQVDTDQFMEVVHRFKEASTSRTVDVESEFVRAKAEIPPKIRILFFAPQNGGFFIMYNPVNRGLVASVPGGYITRSTAIVSDKSENCRLRFACTRRTDQGVIFEIEDSLENVLVIGSAGRMKFETRNYRSLDRFTSPLPSSMLFKIRSFDAGELFTITSGKQEVVVATRNNAGDRFIEASCVTEYEKEAFWRILDYGTDMNNIG